MGKTIGIDLGTTNSVVAFMDTQVKVLRTGDSRNDELCRSCVGQDKNRTFSVGNSTYKNWKRYAPNIVTSVKRLMGASFHDDVVAKMKAQSEQRYPFGIIKPSDGTDEAVAIVLNGAEYSPEQISAEILRRLKKDAEAVLNDEVTHAVITVPAYFNEKQKAATRRAAELAGLKVQRLLAEPTAAAIAYGMSTADSAEDGRVYLVYDFGGGTFDLSILATSGNSFIESGASGDRWLGGDNIDETLGNYVLDQVSAANGGIDVRALIRNLPDRERYKFQGQWKQAVEEAKIALSSMPSATVQVDLDDEDGEPVDFDVRVTREQFERMIADKIDRTIAMTDELMERTNTPIEAIDAILLVGGSSCIPLVKKRLSEKYGPQRVRYMEKPMLAVAEGAAIMSHDLGTEFECPHCGAKIPLEAEECPFCHTSLHLVERMSQEADKVKISFTTKHKTFVKVVDDADNEDFLEIIDEQTPLPLETSRRFHTVVDNQKVVEVQLYSNAEGGTYDKISSGFLSIPQELPAHTDLDFTFNMNEDEVVTSATARIPSLGRTQKITVARGGADKKCFDTFRTTFEAVNNDGDISENRRKDFMKVLQQAVEKINSPTFDPSSAQWSDMEKSVAEAGRKATQQEPLNRDINVTLARVLLDNFAAFIRPEDLLIMDRLVRQANASTPDQRALISSQLEETVGHYSLLWQGFIFNIIGNDASDPVRANKAMSVYNQFMAALNCHDVARAQEIVNANSGLLRQGGIKIEGGSIGLGHG